MAMKIKTRELPAVTPSKATTRSSGAVKATATARAGVKEGDGFAKRTPTLSDYAAVKPFAADPKPIVDFAQKAAEGIGGIIDQVKGILSEYDPKLAGLTALKGLVVAGANVLEQHLPGLGPATKALEDFINTPPPSAPWPNPPPPVSANPALPSGDPRVYTSTDGMPLWDEEKGPQVPADVRQGGLGDCYFMASLAGLDAKAVQDMVHDNEDGTYTVRLYDVDSDGRATPEFVTVTGDLPEPAAAVYGPDGKWAAIVEKAYAVQVGGYDTASGDKNPKFFAAPTVLAGRPTVAYALPISDPDVVFERLQQANADHRPAFTGTYSENPDVLPSHAYTVVDTRTDPATGERYVVLRNPWGYAEPTDSSGAPRDGNDDGVFEMKLEDFMETYQAVAIAGG